MEQTQQMRVEISNVQFAEAGHYFLSNEVKDADVPSASADPAAKWRTKVSATSSRTPTWAESSYVFPVRFGGAGERVALFVEAYSAKKDAATATPAERFKRVGHAVYALQPSASKLLSGGVVAVTLILTNHVAADNVDVHVGKLQLTLQLVNPPPSAALSRHSDSTLATISSAAPTATTSAAASTSRAPSSISRAVGGADDGRSVHSVSTLGDGGSLVSVLPGGAGPPPGGGGYANLLSPMGHATAASAVAAAGGAMPKFYCDHPSSSDVWTVVLGVHGATNLPRKNGRVPEAFVTAKTEQDVRDKAPARAATHATEATLAPVWQELLVVDLPAARARAGEGVLVTMADNLSKRYLGRFLLPIAAFRPDHRE